MYVFKIFQFSANDLRVRTKGGKQQHYKKRKQIFLTLLTLLSADILLRVSSLSKAEVRNFLLLYFPKWPCLVHRQLAMPLQRVKGFDCFVSLLNFHSTKY